MKIHVTVGRTYNIGNFESLRIDVGIDRDIDPADEEPRRVIGKMRQWCLERCDAEAKESLAYIRE